MSETEEIAQEHREARAGERLAEDGGASAQGAPSPGVAPAGDGAPGTRGDGAGTGTAGAAASESAANSPIPDDGDLAEVEEDLDELVKVAAQRDEYLALAQRTQADFENYRKRVARDAAAAQERGVAKLARELLPALDNLDRALEAAEEQDPLLEGVRLVRSELTAALGRVGIESFSPLGETFDPVEHEAIAQQPVEGARSGAVAEVYQAGYRLNGTIIRPARVVVAQ